MIDFVTFVYICRNYNVYWGAKLTVTRHRCVIKVRLYINCELCRSVQYCVSNRSDNTRGEKILESLRWKSMKNANCESSKVEEVHKMRRAVCLLVLCFLVIFVNSILSQPNWSTWKTLVDEQDVKQDDLRLERFGLSWVPSDITVTFKKDIQNITSGYRQGRAFAPATTSPAPKTTTSIQQLPKVLNTATDKIGANESPLGRQMESGN